nr:hypothetical protein [Tanacetum cinerariifolium]
MSSLFADTHNVVAILEKSDAAEGFEQIIDFLNGSYIQYALTVNPHIYISCIKQFWNTVFVKHSVDVTRLQGLVDRKNIAISKDVIRKILQLDDAEGVACLPNEEIFAGLAQMGYKKPSTKLTFTRLSSPNQVGDLSTHTIWYISLALTQKVFANMRRVRKGFLGVETPLFEEDVANDAIPSPPSHDIPSPSQEQSLPPQQPQSSPQAPPQATQKLEIIKLKARVKRLERVNKVKSSKVRRLRKVGASMRIESSDDMEDVFNQGRMIDDMDKDEGIELVVDQEDSEIQEVVEVVNAAKLITEVTTTTASIPISAAKPIVDAVSTPVSAVKPKVLKIVLAAPTVSTRK